MSKNYTLNEFYRSAQKLIDKYKVAQSGCVLEVYFKLTENRTTEPICSILYTRSYDVKFISLANTPEQALLLFEKDILKTTGESILEDLSIEVRATELMQSSL